MRTHNARDAKHRKQSSSHLSHRCTTCSLFAKTVLLSSNPTELDLVERGNRNETVKQWKP